MASLLCSPDSPQPLQDEPPRVSPKPPDSQQLFQVVVGEADNLEPQKVDPLTPLAALDDFQSKEHTALEDVIESFSQDAIAPQLEVRQKGDPCAEIKSNLQEMSTAMVAAESTRKNSDSALYRNVIDVTDDHGLRKAGSALAIVPLAVKPQKPKKACLLTDPVGRPLKRRRPALLSQHLRSRDVSQRSQRTASQRLVGLARRQSRVRRNWILSQSQKDQKAEPVIAAKAAAQFCERPNVLFTGFSRSDLHQLKQSVNCLGGSAVRDLPTGRNAAETRVVVRCTSSKGGQIAGARTMKYLDAVLAGAWVLSPDWVHESMRAGHWLQEGPFELQGDTVKMGGPSRGRHHGPQLFAGFRFHFVAQAGLKFLPALPFFWAEQVEKPKKDLWHCCGVLATRKVIETHKL